MLGASFRGVSVDLLLDRAEPEGPPLRQQVLDLHRHKFVFATGTEDADLMAEVMQPARSNQIRDDEQRGRACGSPRTR